MDKLVKINTDMGLLEYEMYQDIPKIEVGSENPLYGKNYYDFKEYLKQCIEEETIENINFYNTTTNRYIYYINNYPIGEVGIRTNLNDFWVNRGSQIFYKIRLSERRKGYGQKMMNLILVWQWDILISRQKIRKKPWNIWIKLWKFILQINTVKP